MKIITGLLMLSFLLTFNFAQIKDSTVQKNSLKKGSWGVQFQIGSNFTLSSFENVIVSLKTHFSPKFAVRFGVGVNASSSDQTLDYKEYYYGYHGTDIPTNSNSLNIMVLAKVLYYFNPKSGINLFIGLGPIGTYSQIHYERFYLDGYKEYTQTNSWGGGLNGVLGCEIFPLRFLSIFAEYSVTASFEKRTSDDSVEDYYTGIVQEFYNVKSTNFNLTGNTVRFGLSLYF
jgi:hypothetical protein